MRSRIINRDQRGIVGVRTSIRRIKCPGFSGVIERKNAGDAFERQIRAGDEPDGDKQKGNKIKLKPRKMEAWGKEVGLEFKNFS